MKVIKLKNEQEVGSKSAEILANRIKENSKIVLGLATGSTPIPLYNNLIDKFKNKEIDFKHTTTFNLDEYLGLKPTDIQSYRYFMNEKLFNHINIDLENTFIPSGDANVDPSQYDALIEKHGGIDLQVLGLGVNGHIGFNEPNTPFDSLTSIVELTESTIEANSRLFDRKEDVPLKAVSMGLQSIMNAREIILLATGKNKAEAIKQLVEGEISIEWPCTVLRRHENVTVLIDEEAGTLLS
ncbi:glucosamine-6-phosphate deaminase [[Acholeplasma] multilocale]|uniref:glucosamine-6-phosphate deaminase n=1 Tax=[Acholeplasma] multilocale TaxID=264638 RepID=UPI0004796A79|nr:glucosamine-6-phosphate deaminase [[Acholeplasma] multilocale]